MSIYEWMDLVVLWGDTLLKICLVMVAALVGARLLRAKSPSAAHLVWVVALTSALIIPMISFVGPGRSVLFLNLKPLGHKSPDQERLTSANVTPVAGARVSSEAPMVPQDILDWREPTDKPEVLRSPTLMAISVIWVLGTFAVIFRCLYGMGVLSFIGRKHTRPLSGDWIESYSGDVVESLHLRRRVTVRICSSGKFPIPMTWGVIRPIIILPTDAETWTPATLRATLLHEIAHVRRFDFLTQLIAELACAINWFNPLVWMAARSLRSDAELAADEAVVRGGLKPSDYASELLHLAANLGNRPIPYATFGTPAMKNSKIEARLESILDPAAGKRGVTSLQALTGALCALIAVPVFASLHASTQSAPPAQDADERTTALNRAKMLGLGTLMYVNDYDDVYPYVRQSASLSKIVYPYMKDVESFKSPTKGGSFQFNLNLGGVLSSKVDTPASVPMWIESVPDKKASIAVAYADGHAKLVSPADIPTIKKAAARKFPREKTSLPLPFNYMLDPKP